MMLVFSPVSSSRLSYILDFLFLENYGQPYRLTSSFSEYTAHPGPRLNYSGQLSDGINILPGSFLFENCLTPFEPEVKWIKDMPVLFPVSKERFLPFDLLSASFYLISRYEEYLFQPKDIHQRILAENSLASRNKFYHLPVVDIWAEWLKKEIQKRYPDYRFPEKKYRFIPTIDVDIAYSYRHRNSLRTAGATLKAIATGDLTDTFSRFQTLVLGKKDPYDVFDQLIRLFDDKKLPATFFFLLGNYGKFDKNLSPLHSAMKELISRIDQFFQVGIHPSYGSSAHPNRVEKEILTLELILGKRPVKSRQHFLKLSLPLTYQQLIKLGIIEDYSMGNASIPGFRAGTCTPFLFYDLTSESCSTLRIFPFQVMDATLNQYMKLSPAEAFEECKKLIDEVKKVNGTFVSLWHNESLSEMREWKGWSEVFYRLIEEAL